MNLTIEGATLRHLGELYEIETRCFETEAFTKSQIARMLTNYNTVSLIAKEENVIVGFIIGSIYCEQQKGVGHILTLDVTPMCRRRGVGLRLLREIEKMFKEKGVKTCRLEVREDNTAGLTLYAQAGYREAKKLRNYYGAASGLCLQKDLSKLQ